VLAHLKHGDLKAQVLIQTLSRLVAAEHCQANGQDIHLETLLLGRAGRPGTLSKSERGRSAGARLSPDRIRAAETDQVGRVLGGPVPSGGLLLYSTGSN
jgi:hypothetical protein